MLLRGEQLSPARAKAMKLVDQVVPAADLIAAAKRWLKETPRKVQPWDEDGFKLPGGKVYSPAGYNLFPAASALYRRETYDNYPAQRATLKAFVEGLQVPFDVGLRIEARYFAHVMQTKEAAAMIRSLFVSMQELNKLARRPAAAARPSRSRRSASSAPASWAPASPMSARSAGIEVVLLDRDQASGRQGQGDHRGGACTRTWRAAASARPTRDAALARIHAGSDFAALAGADLVIEAVFEDRAVKEDVIRRAEAALGGRDLRLQHLDPADHLARRGRRAAEELHRHPFLLAGRQDDAGRDHHRQEDRRRGARPRPRFRPRHQEDADRRQRLARLLHLARRRHLHRRRPPHADRGRAGGDDRERRRAWPACRSGRWRSTTRSRSTCR